MIQMRQKLYYLYRVPSSSLTSGKFSTSSRSAFTAGWQSWLSPRPEFSWQFIGTSAPSVSSVLMTSINVSPCARGIMALKMSVNTERGKTQTDERSGRHANVLSFDLQYGPVLGQGSTQQLVPGTAVTSTTENWRRCR